MKFIILGIYLCGSLLYYGKLVVPHNFIYTQSGTTKSRTQALSEKEEIMTGMRSCIMGSLVSREYRNGSTHNFIPQYDLTPMIKSSFSERAWGFAVTLRVYIVPTVPDIAAFPHNYPAYMCKE